MNVIRCRAWIVVAALFTVPWTVAARGADDEAANGGKAGPAKADAAGDLGLPDDKTPADDKAKGVETKTKAKGDPGKIAFALPKNYSLTPQQQKAYDQLKADNEDALREAADRLQEATDPKEEAAATKDLNALRAKIRSAIQAILAMPYATPDSAKPQDQYYPNEGSYRPYSSGGYYYPPYGGYYPPYNPWYGRHKANYAYYPNKPAGNTTSASTASKSAAKSASKQKSQPNSQQKN